MALANRNGLHLRPATRFAQEAMRFSSDIRVTVAGQEVNGKSILMLTSLAAERGALLRIRARGGDASEAVDTLVRLIHSRFGEEPAESEGGRTTAGTA